jgi:hypothetical protein
MSIAGAAGLTRGPFPSVSRHKMVAGPRRFW